MKDTAYHALRDNIDLLSFRQIVKSTLRRKGDLDAGQDTKLQVYMQFV